MISAVKTIKRIQMALCVTLWKSDTMKMEKIKKSGKELFDFPIMVKETEGQAFLGNTICIMSVIFGQSA